MYGTPQAFMSRVQTVRIACRNNRVVCGRLKMYDKHFNVVVAMDDDREMFIRGDGIIAISRVNKRPGAQQSVPTPPSHSSAK